jgi:hypothetical protein
MAAMANDGGGETFRRRRRCRQKSEPGGNGMIRTRLNAALIASAVSLLAAAVPATADFRREQQLPLAPGGELVVDVHGSVTVTGGAASGARVVITADRDDVEQRYAFEVGASAGRVEVTSRRLGALGSRGRFRGENLRFEIQVPQQTRVEVDTAGGGIRVSLVAGAVKLRSSGGGLRVSDVEGSLDARTSGGGIDVRGVRGDVRLDTSGGGIKVAEVHGDVHARTSGGGVRIDGVAGQVVAHSSGGPVTAAFAPGTAAGGHLSSSGGGVRVEVDPEARLSIDASSSGGSVTSDLPVTVRGSVRRNQLRGELNGGGPALVLRSSGGGIRIAASRDR